MRPAQADRTLRLIEEYVGNPRPDLADTQLRRVYEAGLDNLHFAWAGSREAGQAHYYRLHGATRLIEYDNTRENADHIHAAWHDLRDDLGIDLLRIHYPMGHHQAQ